MGVVYEALHAPTGRRCAVKLLLAGDRASPELAARFRREALLGARLGDHPGIVAITDCGAHEATGELYCVMDLVSGATLSERIAAGLRREEGVRLCAAVARAVEHAHARGVVHRDLKPDNVLVTDEGQARVTDFGLAKALDEAGGLTATGAAMGTAGFMAPEQLLDSKRAGPAADVYGLGAILYAVLTGRAPYVAENTPAVYSRVVKGALDPPRALVPDTPPALDDLCRRALAVEPAKRPPSAGAFAEELESWLKAASR
jgi:serine/threonine-protein kinase